MISETLSGRPGLDTFCLKEAVLYESISIGIGL